MARAGVEWIEFNHGEIFDLGDGRKPYTKLTRQQARLEVDEDLGVLYANGVRYSCHSQAVRRWFPVAPPAPKKTGK